MDEVSFFYTFTAKGITTFKPLAEQTYLMVYYTRFFGIVQQKMYGIDKNFEAAADYLSSVISSSDESE